MRRNLTKEDRVRKKEQFLRLFASPLRLQTQGMKLFFLKNDVIRVGITLARKYGKAVLRNKVKRQVKEIFRNWKAETTETGDFLFLVYPGVFTFNQRKNQVLDLVQRATVFNS